MQENLVVKKATPLGARVWASLLAFGFMGVCVIEAGTAKPCLSLCTHPLAALW